MSTVDEFGDAALFDPASPYATVDGKRNLLPVQVELDALDPERPARPVRRRLTWGRTTTRLRDLP